MIVLVKKEISKIELIIHPVRIRIIRALYQGPQTTQELDELLSDVPTSSLYRHLRLLLEGDLIGVAETRLVQGIQEKVYELIQMPRLSRDDMETVSREDHLRYFTTFMAILLQGFDEYLESGPDFQKDMFGYNELAVWATPEEFTKFSEKLNAAILPLLRNGKGDGRKQYQLATILFPMANTKQ